MHPDTFTAAVYTGTQLAENATWIKYRNGNSFYELSHESRDRDHHDITLWFKLKDMAASFGIASQGALILMVQHGGGYLDTKENFYLIAPLRFDEGAIIRHIDSHRFIPLRFGHVYLVGRRQRLLIPDNTIFCWLTNDPTGPTIASEGLRYRSGRHQSKL